MIRPSNSFIFSFLIHIALACAIYLLYEYVKQVPHNTEKETLLCIKLSSMTKVAVPVVKKQEKKSVQKIKKIKVKKISKVKEQKREDAQEVVKNIVKKEILEKVVQKITSVLVVQEKENIVKVVKIDPQKEYIDENVKKIIALIKENLYYPRRARKRGIQGEVQVRFTLSVMAKISNIEVLSSSSEILSRGAIQTINNLDNILPKPKQEITFIIPISYTLN